MIVYHQLKIYDKDDFLLKDAWKVDIFSRHHFEDFLNVRSGQRSAIFLMKNLT